MADSKESITPIVTAVANVAAAALGSGVFGSGGDSGSSGPAPYQDIQGPPVPAGPPPDRSSFSDVRPGVVPEAPNFLSLGDEQSNIQRRSQIATRGLSGDDSSYRDPATMDYYRNLALYGLTDASGSIAQGAQPLPIERQYVEQVFGNEPYTGSTESFLSALLRS